MASSSRRWGPDHQHHPGPRDPGATTAHVVLAALGVLVAWGVAVAFGHEEWLLALGALVAARAVIVRLPARPVRPLQVPVESDGASDQLAGVRSRAVAAGGGAYLGVTRGAWVFADPEHGVLLLGPPRSGKTSGVVVPALLACPGACVSTSTKPDVLHATMSARQQTGEVWLFDPTALPRAGSRNPGYAVLLARPTMKRPQAVAARADEDTAEAAPTPPAEIA